jgi:hypothetical protein
MKIERIDAWWGLIFAGGIAGAFGLQLMWGICFNFASAFWQPINARVVGIENFPKSAELRYTYIFDGEEFTGNTFAYLSAGTLCDKDIINRLYPVGGVMTVYVNPRSPRQSVVERRPLEFQYVWKQLLIIAFSTPFVFLSWRTIRTPKKGLRR